MHFKKEGKTHKPLEVFQINNSFILGVYQGSLSKYDILIKYRQRDKNDDWTRIRTPKHIHWAVDILIKMHSEKNQIRKFLDFLIDIWNKTTPIKTVTQRSKILDIQNLLNAHKDKIKKYKNLSVHGEYKIEFLILLAKLLMIQEKTNREDAYMFKKLLDKLREGKDIFSIVSVASHTRR